MKKSWKDLLFAFLGGVVTFLLVVSPSEVSGETSEQSAIVGWRVGSFSLLPNLSLNGAYDSNIYATNDLVVSDRFVVVTPSLALKATGTPHKLELKTGAQMTRFDENRTEDSDDYWLNGRGRYDLAAKSNLFGGFAYSREHEERGSPDEANGLEPTTYFSSGLHLGTEFAAQRFGFRLGGNVQQLDFDDVSTLATVINNDDRDRTLYGCGLRVSSTLRGGFTPFMQIIYDQRRYDQALDDNGFRRDSDGYRAAVGFRSKQTSLYSEVYVGSLWQDYEDPRFATVRDLDIGATISWRAGPGTRIVLTLEREVNETTLDSSSGYLETAGHITLRQQLSTRSTLNIGARFSQDDYQGIDRKDNFLGTDLGFMYELFKGVNIAVEYRFYRQDSKPEATVPLESNDYDRHQLFLTFSTKI